MTLHAQGVYPGDVPITWLEENDLYNRRYCVQLVSNIRLSSHTKKCVGGAAAALCSENTPTPSDDPPAEVPPPDQLEPSIPTFEEVCLLNQPTLSFIPIKIPACLCPSTVISFAFVIQENSEEAWLKLFMLPKCVLPSLRRQGHHDKPLPVDVLCNMWTDNDLGPLWNLGKGRAISHTLQSTYSIHQNSNNADMAISLNRPCMFGKACRILQSSGIAINNENTW